MVSRLTQKDTWEKNKNKKEKSNKILRRHTCPYTQVCAKAKLEFSLWEDQKEHESAAQQMIQSKDNSNVK